MNGRLMFGDQATIAEIHPLGTHTCDEMDAAASHSSQGDNVPIGIDEVAMPWNADKHGENEIEIAWALTATGMGETITISPIRFCPFCGHQFPAPFTKNTSDEQM